MRITSYGISDIGRKRKNNEDNYLIDHDLSLFIVADGMGGHAGGEKASHLAVTTIGDIVKAMSSSSDPSIAPGDDDAPAPVRILKYAIKKAGNIIHEKAVQDPQLKGMGTTCTTMWIREGTAYIAHVGDSRAYLVRSGALEQITDDHSWVREQIKAGILSPTDAKAHSFKNIITRSVGFEEEVKADAFVRAIAAGDRFLLCSDGLSNLVKEADISSLLPGTAPKEACQKLISLALERGGDDNVTTIVIGVEE